MEYKTQYNKLYLEKSIFNINKKICFNDKLLITISTSYITQSKSSKLFPKLQSAAQKCKTSEKTELH